MMKWISTLLISFSFLGFSFEVGATARLKDITNLQGVRDNQLIGYGLVVGLSGTGDGGSNQMTIQSLATMLNNLGVGVDPRQVASRNVASVIVTAYLPPFARSGSKVDILVSSLGDSTSLQGGTLLLTPLKGADGQVYAVAQGPITLGGFSAEAGGASQAKNHSTVGKVPGGAVIEAELPFDFAQMGTLTYALKNPDFTTANRMADAINKQLKGKFAKANDSGTVNVQVPERFKGKVVELVSSIEGLAIRPDTRAKVVVNERTGTVVVGEDVRISTVAVAHGNLSITIQPQTLISQPQAFSDGETVVVEESFVEVQEGEDKFALIPGGVSIGDLVRALNAIGISPRDLIAVFQAIQSSGALQAELEII
jgi:flagellar P-ring protein precursor FlgI